VNQLFKKYHKIFIWLIIILFISLTPASKIPNSNILLIKNFDKVVHFGMYFIFSAIISRIINIEENKALIYVIIPITLTLFTGGMLEIIQSLLPINRSCSLGDFIANFMGGIAGTLFFLYTPSNFKIKKIF